MGNDLENIGAGEGFRLLFVGVNEVVVCEMDVVVVFYRDTSVSINIKFNQRHYSSKILTSNSTSFFDIKK